MTAETKPLPKQPNDGLLLPNGGDDEEGAELPPSSGDAKEWESAQKSEQTDPPRVGLSELFPSGEYPEGEILEYGEDNAWRTTSEEKRYIERLAMEDLEDTYNNIRRAAEVHRQVRKYARGFIRPGMKLLDIAEEIETSARALVEESGLESGIGFPTGLNINDCAAHSSPNPGDATGKPRVLKQIGAEIDDLSAVLSQGDVLKVDFGIHVKGRILDSAFTLTWDHTYDKLLDAVKDATNTGIREAGIDVRLGELAGLIQETLESYEVEVGARTIPVRPIENFSGHSIKPYRIHGGKSLLLVRNDDSTKMEEGEYFAIETFGSTGRGLAFGFGECSHYAKAVDAPNVPLQWVSRNDTEVLVFAWWFYSLLEIFARLNTAKGLMKTISKEFGTLTFCRRYLDRIGESKYLFPLNYLVSQGVVREYPPLMEERGAITAQFEHTILLRPTVKEVVSRGDDY